jgi:hypothetical protein
MCISPSLEYLVTSSQAGLENFELVRLNTIANLRKELGDLVEEWIEAEIQSRLARWILECRRTQDSASDLHLSELSGPLPVEAIDEEPPPLFDATPNSHQIQSQSSPVKPFPNRSARSRRDSFPVREALPLPSTQLSCRARKALNFLERQVRLQTDAIAPNVYASLFPVALGHPGGSDSACAQTRLFGAGNCAKRDVPKGQASPGSADIPQIVALIRGEKLRPTAPTRASIRYSPPQRKAV